MDTFVDSPQKLQTNDWVKVAVLDALGGQGAERISVCRISHLLSNSCTRSALI